MRSILLLMLGLVGSVSSFAADSAQKIYVRSEQAKIVEQARFNAAPVASVKRGTELEVVAKQGAWWHVRTANGKTGWLPHAFISEQPLAMSTAEVAKADASDPRSARRRGPRAASMGVRGLNKGADKLSAKDADVKALEKVESQRVPAEDVQRYQNDLKND